MKPLMMAAIVVQLTSAGGAGSGQTREQGSGSTMKDVGKHFTALRTEVTSLSQQFREAREKARLEAERRKQEADGAYVPQNQRAAVPAAPPGGGSSL
ncbi:hypothetical protein [Hyalangium versicolor]|uniref:hypothetical protein n=1 Tax=Hyalangium versicolor TaxID=2861190 RepID=UPI001CC9DA76|nr:hypothetical protein [Hyalangium versicolor]